LGRDEPAAQGGGGAGVKRSPAAGVQWARSLRAAPAGLRLAVFGAAAGDERGLGSYVVAPGAAHLQIGRSVGPQHGFELLGFKDRYARLWIELDFLLQFVDERKVGPVPVADRTKVRFKHRRASPTRAVDSAVSM